MLSKSQELPQVYGRTRAQTKALGTQPVAKRVDVQPVRKTRRTKKKTGPRSFYDVMERVDAREKNPRYAWAMENVRRNWKEVYRKPKVFYPIYSDLPGAWQADLMFYTMKNRRGQMVRRAILNMVHVNTRFAMSELLQWEAASNKREGDESYTPNQQKELVRGITKNAEKTLAAFRRILHKIQLFNRDPRNAENRGIKVRTLYTDDGSEFKGAFAQYCHDNDIRLVQFKPSEGLKTRLGIVERLNRSIRGYLAKYWEFMENVGEPRPPLQEALDDVLNKHNRKPSLSLSKLGLRDDGRLARSPLELTVKTFEPQIMEKKREQTARVDDHYRTTIDKLEAGDRFRYFLNPAIEKKKDAFFKASQQPKLSDHRGTYATERHVIKPGRTRFTADKEFRTNTFKVHGTNRRVLPYDVEFVQDRVITL